MATKFTKLVVSGLVSVSLTLSGISIAKAEVVKNDNHQKQELKVQKLTKDHDDDEDDEDDDKDNDDEVEINSTVQNYRKDDFKLVVSFDKDLNRKTINTKNISLTKIQVEDEVKDEVTNGDSTDETAKAKIAKKEEVKNAPIKVRLSSDKEDIIITLKEDLEPNALYTLSLSGIKDFKGNSLEDKEFEIKTLGNFSDEIEEVDDFKGKLMSQTSIKWTWEYDDEDEEDIDGFILYDAKGNQLTEIGEIAADEREYIQEDLKLNVGEKYKVEIAAYRLSDEGENEVIEGERESASVEVKELSVVNIPEEDFTGKVSGKNIIWSWDTKPYRGDKNKYSKYVVRISEDESFEKYKEVSLIKGKYLEKAALSKKDSKDKKEVVRYYQVVNKEYDIKGDIQKKVFIFDSTKK